MTIHSVTARTLIVIAWLSVAVCLSGCGGGAESTAGAEAGFWDYVDAVKTKSLDTVGEHVTGWQEHKLLGVGAVRRVKQYADGFPTDIKIVESKMIQTGEAQVFVEITDENGKRRGKFDMLYQGDMWKVNNETWEAYKK